MSCPNCNQTMHCLVPKVWWCPNCGIAKTPTVDEARPKCLAEVEQLEQTQGDLVMLVNRLVYQIRQSSLPRATTDQALEFLERKNLTGKFLRDDKSG